MSDTSLPVTPGSGVNVDGRTESGNGDFRQVIVIGDPSASSGVAPVDGTLGLGVQVTALAAGLTVGINNFPASQVVSGSVSVSNFPSIQVVSGSVTVSGGVSVLNFPATQVVSGAVSVSNFPSTQPVSAASLPLPSGASTEATLALIKAKTDNIDVALSTRTKPADTQIVSVSNFPATQPVSAASLPLPSGASTAAKQPALGTAGTPSADVISVQGEQGMTPLSVSEQPAALVQSVTAATGVAVTATLPAVAGQFHYITLIEIVKYFTVANAASATPLVVTTTNLPGSLAYTFGQPLGTVGTTDKMMHNPNSPIKSSVVNTATTIVCPATTGIIWRINVYYYATT